MNSDFHENGMPNIESETPFDITFFSNGTACVGNRWNKQIGKFQVGNHQDTIDELFKSGYDWRSMRVYGSPRLNRPAMQ